MTRDFERGGWWLRRVFPAAVVFALSVAAFIRASGYGLVNFDDYLYVERIPSGFNGWFSDLSCGIWMPLTWASYALDRALFGVRYGFWHVTGILVHGVNAVLVYVYFREVVKKVGRLERVDRAGGFAWLLPVLAALLWAVHPLRVESVVALSSRKDVLSLFFELVALVLWLKNRRDWDVIACAAFVLGSLCKPSVMTFPLLCLVVDAFVLGRLDLRRYAFPAAFALFLGLFAAYQQKAGGATVDMFHEGLLPRIVDAASAFGIYVRNTFWPQWLAPQCMKKFPLMPRLWQWGLAASAFVGFICLRRALPYFGSALRQLRERRLVLDFGRRDLALAGLAWFAVAIAPMLGIANFGFHAFADRFTYIPAIGLGFLVFAAFELLARPMHRAFLCAAFAAAVAALSVRAWHQAGFWRDDGALFSRTLEVDGEPNAVAHATLGAYHFEFTHDLEECVRHFALAEKQDVRFMMIAYNVYVFALCELGRTEEVPRLLERFREVWNATTGGDGDTVLDRRFRGIYAACEVAYLASAAASADRAERALWEWSSRGALGGAEMTYLRWRVALARGDERGAATALAELSGHSEDWGYLRFRYMSTKGKGAS